MRGLFFKTMVRRDLFRATVAATAALATGIVSLDTPATGSSRGANKRRSRYQADSAEVPTKSFRTP